MVGTEVELLDADMNIVASKVVKDQQGELFTPLLSSALRRTIVADIYSIIAYSQMKFIVRSVRRYLLFQLSWCYRASSTNHPTVK